MEAIKVEIKPSMIQPVQEVKSLGKFKVKISLHLKLMEITINVNQRNNSIIIQFHPQLFNFK